MKACFLKKKKTIFGIGHVLIILKILAQLTHEDGMGQNMELILSDI